MKTKTERKEQVTPDSIAGLADQAAPQLINPDHIGVRIIAQQYDREFKRYREISGSAIKVRVLDADVDAVVDALRNAVYEICRRIPTPEPPPVTRNSLRKIRI